MNALRTLFLLAASLSVACCASVLSRHERALSQFWFQIRCEMPTSKPIMNYADYGCYCGKGGGGTPVDELDRCCEVHDKCYGDAMQLKACWSVFHNPYSKRYSYSCDKASKTLNCKEKNNECEMFICECDRKAAECFAKSPWLPENEHLPSDRCQ